jgi:hypothetical protein
MQKKKNIRKTVKKNDKELYSGKNTALHLHPGFLYYQQSYHHRM